MDYRLKAFAKRYKGDEISLACALLSEGMSILETIHFREGEIVEAVDIIPEEIDQMRSYTITVYPSDLMEEEE